MKWILSIFLCLPFLNYGQKNNFKVIHLPSFDSSAISSMQVNDAGKIFIPLSGGIYMPEDTMWFIEPNNKFYFTSFIFSPKDTGVFLMGNTKDSSQLIFSHANAGKHISRIYYKKIEKGIYHVEYENGVCYVWGYCKGSSKIGIVTGRSIEWLINIKGVIQDVKFLNHQLYFALENAIFCIEQKKTFLSLNERIYGFDFNEKGVLILSTESGLSYYSNKSFEKIATGAKGMIAYKNKKIYVLSRKMNSIFIL